MERGDGVAATVGKENSLHDLKDSYGGQLWVATLDVTDTPAIKTMVNQAFEELGQIVHLTHPLSQV